MKYVELMKLFVLAERRSNWQLHLYVVTQMLDLFAATGHNYAKSAHLCIQQMNDLLSSHPHWYEQFMARKYAIHRTDKYWNGLSSYLVIEQTMKKSVKGTGGLT